MDITPLLLGAALVLGLLMLCIRLLEEVLRRLGKKDPEGLSIESVSMALVYGGFAVGLIVPPVAILWMAFA